MVDQLTQNLINAFENKEIIPSNKDEKEKMFGKFMAECLFIQWKKIIIYRWTKYYLNIQNTLISGNCTSCGNLIENEANVVNGQHYHPSCFTCDKCKNPLGAEKYFILKGGSYCKNCKDVSLYVHVFGGILKKVCYFSIQKWYVPMI